MPLPTNSVNPYESPRELLLDDRGEKPNWARALCIAIGFAGAAIVLFGLLQLFLNPRREFPSPPLTLENVSNFVSNNFFVALWFAGPMAFAAALIDFAPRKRLGVIRSLAIAGGSMVSIYIVTVLAMSLFDELHRDTFVRARNTYGQQTTWRSWVGLALGQILWSAGIAAILQYRLRASES